ncbi:hypothetical protein Pen02_49120 [Plantactinospora endophytica]|uniref:Uncharacterized protein n=1 Tax=Plantactinospora endophytica TaxID=673535 RepID=A0ABQ4E5J8_9ACTN|nr:hypothetical protein Pen02_49120 [Plantactinospora endophytica]
MSAAKPGSTIDLTTIPRAVLSVAVGVVQSVERAMIGDARIRTARGNAWEAICADRDRALRRDEIRALVAALAVAPPPAPEVGPGTTKIAHGSAEVGRSTTEVVRPGTADARQPVG